MREMMLFLSGVAMAGGVSLAVVLYLKPDLTGLLVDLCGTAGTRPLLGRVLQCDAALDPADFCPALPFRKQPADARHLRVGRSIGVGIDWVGGIGCHAGNCVEPVHPAAASSQRASPRKTTNVGRSAQAALPQGGSDVFRDCSDSGRGCGFARRA